jgi:multiple sugar transport system permease protein
MILAALHPQGAPLPTSLNLRPAGLTLANFPLTWSLAPFGRFTANSLLVCLIAVPLTLLVGSWAGYAMARLPSRSQQRWVVLSLAVLKVPGNALWSTRFVLYDQLGWLDSLWALAAPAWMGTSPFYVLMFYRAFRRIPSDVYDASRIDGAGIIGTWWRVAGPISRPTAIAVALLAFVVYWGDNVSPLLYLRSEQLYTLPAGLQLVQQLYRSDWSILMAGAVIASALPLLFFLILQPYFARVGD